MGKISKALEKAGKNALTQLVRKPSDAHLHPQKKTAESLSKIPPVDWSDRKHSVYDQTRQDRVSANLSNGVKVAVPLNSQPASEPSPSVDDSPVELRETNREPPTHFPNNTFSQPPDRDGKSISGMVGDVPKPETINIGLMTSEKVQSPPLFQQVAGTLEPEKRTGEKPSTAGPARKRAINVRYSTTKVQVNDPEKLKNNKIISVFDDMETTEQIKILRTQILKKLNAIGGNIILVTSANPYEGKTFTSINLGVSVAKEFDRTVLIIDADLRKPTKRHTAFATDFFSLKVDLGLTDYLEGEADIPDILINPGINRLTLIPSGKPVSNAPELLNAFRMEKMMAEVKSRYGPERLVIVDGPAMLPFPDAMILARYVDGVIPVVEVEKTSSEDLKRMMEKLKGTLILGTVLNKKKE